MWCQSVGMLSDEFIKIKSDTDQCNTVVNNNKWLAATKDTLSVVDVTKKENDHCIIF